MHVGQSIKTTIKIRDWGKSNKNNTIADKPKKVTSVKKIHLKSMAEKKTDNESLDAQPAEVIDDRTITVDGKTYRLAELPAEGVNIINDMIRCENEANEHQFRLRQIINAQQGLTASLKQCIETAGLKTLEIDTTDETDEEPREEAA